MDANAPVTRTEFHDFMEKFACDLNKAFNHIYKRCDGIEQKLHSLELKINEMGSDIHSVKNDARLIQPIFEMTRMDSEEIGQLQICVDNLESTKK